MAEENKFTPGALVSGRPYWPKKDDEKRIKGVVVEDQTPCLTFSHPLIWIRPHGEKGERAVYRDSVRLKGEKKLDAEKRDALVRQLESDVVDLMDERDDLLKIRANLQAKVTEQAAELEKAIQVRKDFQDERDQAVQDRDMWEKRCREWKQWGKKRHSNLSDDLSRQLTETKAELDSFKREAADWEKWGKRENALVYREREKLDAVRKLVQDLEKKVESDLKPDLGNLWLHQVDAAQGRLGVHESAAASIKRGFATKRILDRLKAALEAPTPNVTVEYKFDDKGFADWEKDLLSTEQPKTRYWKSLNFNHVWRGACKPMEVFTAGADTEWRKARWDSVASLQRHFGGVVEISASDLPEGVTP